MHKEEKYYAIEYLVGPDSTKDSDWAELSDLLTDYRFDEAEAAIIKATQIARQGKWGQPIKLRVMKYIKTVNSWYIGGFDPEDHYQK